MKFRTTDARLLSQIIFTEDSPSRSSHPTCSPYGVALRAWDCVPSFECARAFMAALADPGWHRWCYLRVCLPLSPWGSRTSDTPLCRSPRSQTWRDEVEPHVGGPASARLGSQLKAILRVQTCEGREPAGVPVPGVKSPPAIASSQMRPEVSWSRETR